MLHYNAWVQILFASYPEAGTTIKPIQKAHLSWTALAFMLHCLAKVPSYHTLSLHPFDLVCEL